MDNIIEQMSMSHHSHNAQDIRSIQLGIILLIPITIIARELLIHRKIYPALKPGPPCFSMGGWADLLSARRQRSGLCAASSERWDPDEGGNDPLGARTREHVLCQKAAQKL